VIKYFTKPILKVPLAFGALAGVLSFMYFLALYWLGITPAENKRTPEFGLNVILMAVAVWYYRKYHREGVLHLWEGLIICYIVNSVAAMLTGWLIYGFITFIDRGVFEDILKAGQAELLANKAVFLKEWGEQTYNSAAESILKTKPEDTISRGFIWKSLMTVFAAPIVSLIFRKQSYNVLNPKG